MLRRVLWCSPLSGLVLALAAGVAALSCGGGAERQTVSGPAPVAVQPPTSSDDGGSIGEAAAPTKTLLCHYDATTGTVKDLAVPLAAQAAHVSHGDVLGSCAGACPCFTAGHGLLACPTGLVLGSTCYGEFSLQINCAPPPPATDPGPALELRGVALPATCYAKVGDAAYFERPSFPDFPQPLTLAQVAACKQFIVTSPYYPTCTKNY